jgi:cell division septation protein DedD
MRILQTHCRSAIFILTLSGFFGPRCWATVYHSDGTAESVQFFHDNQAQNGDTITLPAGTFTWTSGVTITKAVTLQGAGVGSTIIRDDIQGGARIMVWTLVPGLPSRMTGIELQDAGANHQAAPAGAFHVAGSNTDGSSFRMDHCSWNNINGSPVFDTVLGVVDHTTFYCARPGYIMFYVYGSNWDGQGPYGDGSWHDPANFGSSQFLFFEDNTFTFNVGGLGTISDAYAGARFVVRYNTIHDGVLNNHGTESTGRTRGGRAYEAYNNIYAGSGWNKFLSGCRSGTMLFHDNTISGYWGSNAICGLGNYRTHMTFPTFGGADGANAWDVNEPNTFFTGTAAANSAGTTETVSGANWSTNQWKGYSVRRLTNLGNLNTVTFAMIEGNTSNTITYSDNGGYSLPSLAFTAGDSLEIRKIRHVLDGIGRGQGSLVTGGVNTTPPAGWNDQVAEPCYSWNNVITDGGGAHAKYDVSDPSITLNQDVFNDTVMPGYTPYIYPHPLVTGEPMPSPTPSATVTPSPTPTATPTPSPTSPPSPTPTPSATATPLPTSTPSGTATPTATPTPTATATPSHKHRPHRSHAAWLNQ